MAEQAADRERWLLQVFGDVLPDATTDDVVDHLDDPRRAREQWLRDNCPPHHDGHV
ncbi:MAG: hypothetical protein ACT4NY_08450 [Pseudonocardiales bacterium]